MITQHAQATHASKLALDKRVSIFAPSRKTIMLWCIALFSAGFVLRIALLLLMNDLEAFPHPETVSVAISLATTGKFADAYGPGVGPTAHYTPLFPLLLSVLLRIFGTGAAAAVAMKFAASFISALAFALLPVLAVESGLPPVSGMLAGAAGALIPFNFWFQVGGTQVAPYAGAALVGLCILVCRIRGKSRFMMRDGAFLGITIGLGCLLSPVILPPMLGYLIVLVVEHRRRLQHMLIFFAATAACFMATLAPWAIRNYEVLGSLIWTRSNFWMELNLSNNDFMTADELHNFTMPEFARMHPSMSAVQRAQVEHLGEVAYNRKKRKQVLTWIASHKRRFLELTVERLQLFWMPRMKRHLQTALEIALTILGLSGLVLLFRIRAASAWMFASLVLLFPGVYYLIMVNPRFRLPLEPFLYLLAGYCVVRIGAATKLRHRTKPVSNTVSARL